MIIKCVQCAKIFLHLIMMERYINKLVNLEILSVNEVEDVCTKAIEVLVTEPNFPNVHATVSVCGDIHGQIFDLVGLFKLYGTPKYRRYVFLGDYVDRGQNSVECILLLLIYKVLYPTNIYLVRGNHEQMWITKTYGFYDEIATKYSDLRIWRLFCDVFTYFNIGCIVEGRVLCVHGGITPKTLSMNVLKRIDRFSYLNIKDELEDITWSDPHDGNGFGKSERRSGCCYGPDVTNSFLECNDLCGIIRSHQLTFEGYKFHFPDKNVVTVWGAPNYIGKFSNPASFMRIEDDLEISDQRLCIYSEFPKTLEFLKMLDNN